MTRDEFRQGVFARDGGRCVICGSSMNPDAHHVVERRLRPLAIYSPVLYYLNNGNTTTARFSKSYSTKEGTRTCRALCRLRERSSCSRPQVLRFLPGVQEPAPSAVHEEASYSRDGQCQEVRQKAPRPATEDASGIQTAMEGEAPKRTSISVRREVRVLRRAGFSILDIRSRERSESRGEKRARKTHDQDDGTVATQKGSGPKHSSSLLQLQLCEEES